MFPEFVTENIKNNTYFARIMPFLDNPKVMEEIKLIRGEMHLNEPVEYSRNEEWFNEQYSPTISAFFPRATEAVLKKYGRLDIELNTFFTAVICGHVEDIDCSTCSVEIVGSGYQVPFSIPKLAIIFSPNSTEEQIVAAFSCRKTTVDRYNSRIVTEFRDFPKLTECNANIDALREQREIYMAYVTRDLENNEGYGSVSERLQPSRDFRSGYRTYLARVKNAIRLQ